MFFINNKINIYANSRSAVGIGIADKKKIEKKSFMSSLTLAHFEFEPSAVDIDKLLQKWCDDTSDTKFALINQTA